MSLHTIRQFPVCVALLALMTLTTTQVQAKGMVGISVCPTGSETINMGTLTVNTPTRDRVTFTVNKVFFVGVTGTLNDRDLTSARILVAVVDGNGHPVHYVYFPLGTISGLDPSKPGFVPGGNVNLPAQPARTFYNLKPNTRYAVRLFADQLKGPGDTPITRTWNRIDKVVGSVCFRTAS